MKESASQSDPAEGVESADVLEMKSGLKTNIQNNTEENIVENINVPVGDVFFLRHGKRMKR